MENRIISHFVRAILMLCLLHTQAGMASIKVGGSRPADLYLPKDMEANKTYPMVLVLHGYDNNGRKLNFWTGISQEASELGYIALIPEGSPDWFGNNYWNATKECCDYFFKDRDDVSYLAGIIAEAKSLAPVGDVYIMGHSNGGFMAFRMACERPELISGIVSVSAGFFKDPLRCQNPTHTSALEIHGTKDHAVPYKGNWRFSSPRESMQNWANIMECQGSEETKNSLDLIESILLPWSKGLESDDLEFTGCREGAKVGLWTINGAGHNFTYDHLLEKAMKFFAKP